MWRIKKWITDKNTFQSNMFIVCLVYIINVCSNRVSSHWYRVCNGRRRTWEGAKTLSGNGNHESHNKTNGDFKGVLLISKQKYSEQFYNRRNHGSKIDAENTHIRDRSLSLLGTCTSIKSSGVKLVLWVQTSPLSEMMSSCKYFRHVIKMPYI